MVGAMPVNLIPKFCNGSLDSRNGIDSEDIQIHVGSRVKCGDDFGTVMYIGEVQGYKGTWYGVEWDDASRGKHDGCVEGVQYFKTQQPKSGSFVRPAKILPPQTCAEAIKKSYEEREDETVAAHRRTAINEWKREMGAPFIMMVGFDKIHQKQQSDRLTDISVRDRRVAAAGAVAPLCPRARSVDAARNLFANWREVISLASQLPELSALDVSKNRMIIDIPEDIMSQHSASFANLRKLNISGCWYDWSDIQTLSHLWPGVTELVVAFNRIDKIDAPETMQSLASLWLDGNPVASWREVVNLGNMAALKMLSLNECGLKEIRFEDKPTAQKVDVFENLEVLFLNRNEINDWRSISELNKLKSLKKLYFLKNPALDAEDYDTGSQMIIAKIGSLMELNGSLITRELRRGAEYDYMKRYGAEWKLSQTTPEAKLAFDTEHNRFAELVHKYGVPEDSLLVKQTRDTTLISQLVQIRLQDETGKKYDKRFPATMQVQKLVTLAQRLFTPGNYSQPELYCRDDQMNADIHLDNTMKDLGYYSIKNGDTILVKFR